MVHPILTLVHSFTFEAAHRLPFVPNGHKCARLHGHSYRVDLVVTGPLEPKQGWVIDFYTIESVFQPLLDQLDHHTLNDVEGLENPTAELLAIWLWDRLSSQLPVLSMVRIYETPQTYVEYSGAMR